MKELRFEFTVTVPDDDYSPYMALVIKSALAKSGWEMNNLVVTLAGEEYEPKTGDVVVFPAAALKSNRTRLYTITNVQGNVVAFRVWGGDDAFDYSETVEVLRDLGMRLA